MPEMSFESFKNWALESVKNYLPFDYRNAEVDIHTLSKIGEEYTGLTVRKAGQMSAAAINLEDAYEAYKNGMPVQLIGIKMAEIVQSEPPFDLSIFANYESVKKNLFIRICNVAENRDVLETVPHKTVEDLAITYHILVSNSRDGMASAMITNDILNSFGISQEQLHKDALANSERILPVRIDSMMNIMSDLIDMDMESIGVQNDPSMIVITNRDGLNGASALFYEGTMEEVSQMLHGDYFVLPSSIHELIAIPVSMGQSYRDLERMVREVNAMTVAPQDQLSDRVYRYDSKEHTFELAATQAARARKEMHKKKEAAR